MPIFIAIALKHFCNHLIVFVKIPIIIIEILTSKHSNGAFFLCQLRICTQFVFELRF